MEFNNPDFLELCDIILERNDLCKRRNTIRSRVYRLNGIYRNKTHNNKKSLLVRRVTYTHNNKINKLKQAGDAFLECLTAYDVREAVHKVAHIQAARIIEDHQRDAIYLEDLGKWKPVPVKYRKMTQRQLHIQILEAQRDYAQINLEIGQFTERTHKRLLNLANKLEIKMRRDTHSNKYNGIRLKSGEYLDMKEILRIKHDQIFEEEILRA